MDRFFILLIALIYAPANTSEYKSQCCQDQFVNEHFFHDMKGGFFLDIGAHDGQSFSNTWYLEKNCNWFGICFEPLPHLYKKLKECRTCICVNACVSAIQGALPFLHIDGCDEMLSGLCGTYDQRALNAVMSDIKQFGGDFKVLQLPSVRLDSVLEQFGVTHVDYLSLDTEGNELEILKTIDFSKITINVIDVENNYNEPFIKDFLTANGYTFVTRLTVDDIYVRNGFAG